MIEQAVLVMANKLLRQAYPATILINVVNE